VTAVTAQPNLIANPVVLCTNTLVSFDRVQPVCEERRLSAIFASL